MPDQPYQPYQPMGQGQQRPDPTSIYPTPQQNIVIPAAGAPGPTPSNPTTAGGDDDPAVEMIRQKISSLYADEPDAKQELAQAEHHTHPGSKHQIYMAGLHASGRSLAEIQAAWHSYYTELPDHEKYEVWQEFYSQNGAPASQPIQTAQPAPHHAQAHRQPLSPVQGPLADQFAQALAAQPLQNPSIPTAAAAPPQPETPAVHHSAGSQAAHAAHHRVTHRDRALKRQAKTKQPKAAKTSEIKQRIVDTVKTAAASDGRGKLGRKHHIQSAMFGLACGLITLFIFLFSFFNEVIIAPFIQPSRQANDTPVIVDTASAVISGGPKIIIPKINLEIPVDYSQTTTDSKAIELALDNGVVHYPSTVRPGETGNAAYFGHSSNNIFNPGKYKFAFVLLHELVEGDVFYLNYGDKTYAYKVFKKHIVTPKQVEVLQAIPGKSATVTLITCDPPGTSINRLVVVGEQVSPDPNSNGQPQQPPVQTASGSDGTDTTASANPKLPGNGPGLWSRIIERIF